MSKPTEQGEKTSRSLFSTSEDSSIVDVFERLYHIPLLGAIIAFMLWIRVQSYDNFIIGGEVYFTGNDPWYHFRETTYTVLNYPFTMPYDIWTNYPQGQTAGQFGTLWDQLVATVILIVGLGNPTEMQAGMVMLVATAVMAALCVIPTYLIARRFISRPAAIFSVLLLALIPGQFLTRSLAGSFQHHAAETFFMSMAVFAMLVAISVAERHTPVWELVVDRDFEALKKPLLYSALAGVATALYLYVWQPGVLLVGIFGAFFLIKITADVVHDDTPEPVTFVAAVSMTVAGLMMIIPLEEFTFGVTAYSYTQIFLPIAVAAGAVFLAFLARQWEQRDLDTTTYPAAVGGILLATVLFLVVALPNVWSLLFDNFVRFIGFGALDTQQTIAEAQPLLAQGDGVEPVIREYGLTFFFAAAGFLGLILMPLFRSDDANHTFYAGGGLAIVGILVALPALPEAVFGLIGFPWQLGAFMIGALLLIGAMYQVEYETETMLLIVWTGFLIAAAFTQVRFNYYLVIPVVVLTAMVFESVINWADLSAESASEATDKLKNIEGWQVMVVAAIALAIIVPGLMVPIEAAGSSNTAWNIGAGASPGAVVAWDDTFDWMQEETPYPGELEGHDNRLDYYGTVENPGDGSYEYPGGTYGVMSWWDYGHWITTQGERIPHANPFQRNAGTAANYLLAPTEAQSADVIDDLNSDNEADAQTRYVMVDWQMASPTSKFGAPIVWYDEEDVSQEDFLQLAYPQMGDQFGQPTFVRQQRYYESQMIRLYEFHGSAVDPSPIVVETQEQTVELPDGGQVTVDAVDLEDGIQEFDTIEEAEAYVDDNPGAQIGGIGPNPSERVDALEHYRLVKSAETPASFSNQDLQIQTSLLEQVGISEEFHTLNTPQWVKTFERVPGATVEGSGAPANSEVRAQVEMRDHTTDQTFVYQQYAEADEDGNFEMTLPYSTVGYEDFGPENGYTNIDVTAEGEYQFTAVDEDAEDELEAQLIGVADVDEAQVVGEDESAVTVELDTPEIDFEEEEADADGDSSEEDDESDEQSQLAAPDVALTPIG
ncbi:oligosaccharyl transferase, archaeosortase A system-associated [Halorubraceae archaeon YAN]|nr:oligosaccharyl transferase, archaeosortase A system-associated [Halorubraceae archaeon YAN]